MPTIFFYGPKLDKDKRRDMIKSFTKTASRITGIEKSAFEVYLRESTLENVETAEELSEDKGKREKGKILIVEDDQGVSGLIKNFLEDRGYRLEVAKDATKAKTLLKQGSYKLIFTDVVFYWSAGIDLIKAIREKDEKTPIIVITECNPKMAQEALEAGASDVLLKPFDILQMKRKIGKFVDIDMMEKRFGSVAVDKGFITLNQLTEALKIQVMEDIKKGKHRLLGVILLEQGDITNRQINEVLESLTPVRLTLDLIK